VGLGIRSQMGWVREKIGERGQKKGRTKRGKNHRGAWVEIAKELLIFKKELRFGGTAPEPVKGEGGEKNKRKRKEGWNEKRGKGEVRRVVEKSCPFLKEKSGGGDVKTTRGGTESPSRV